MVKGRRQSALPIVGAARKYGKENGGSGGSIWRTLVRTTAAFLALACLTLAACGPFPGDDPGNRAYYDRDYGPPIAAEQTACGVTQKYSTATYHGSPRGLDIGFAGLIGLVRSAFSSDKRIDVDFFIIYEPDGRVRAFRWLAPPRCAGSAPDRRDLYQAHLLLAFPDPKCVHPSDFEAYLRLSVPTVDGHIEHVWHRFGALTVGMRYDFPGMTEPVDFSQNLMVVRPGEGLRACIFNKSDAEVKNKSDPGVETACVANWGTNLSVSPAGLHTPVIWDCVEWLQAATALPK